MMMKTVRAQYWRKAILPIVALIGITAYGLYTGSNQFLLFNILPALYLLFGTGTKCNNCHNPVQQVHSFIYVPWCPKSCYTCGKNLSRR